MGSAAAYHHARRGARVLGIEQFAIPHAQGSSHGDSRIIRQAYFEHPLYVPLVQRAYQLWDELERSSGSALFARTGGLMLGAADSQVVQGARRSAAQHGLRHDVLDARALSTRFPQFRLAPTAAEVSAISSFAPRDDRDGIDDVLAVWEPDAGFLRPEACIAAHLSLATAHGAELRMGELVQAWGPVTGGVSVTTPDATRRTIS